MTTERRPETEQPSSGLTDFFPPYAVILHNDDTHSMEYVVDALLKSVPELSRADAVDIMSKAHNEGRSIVIVCPLERAELYRDRIQSFGLGVSIEKQ